MENLKKKVIEIVKENMIENQEKIIKETDELVGDLGYDSIRFMGLFYTLEDEFDIQIINSVENYLFFSVETVQDLIDLLQKLNIE
ncbi:MAG: acyl carrier protein [Thomasclavelia spiroformis]